MAYTYNFYNKELEAELSKVDDRCERIVQLFKSFRASLMETTGWVGANLSTDQRESFIKDYKRSSLYIAEIIIEEVGPKSYKKLASKKDFKNYTLSQFNEYISSLNAYCAEIIEPKNIPSTLRLRNRVIRDAITKPWNKATKQEWSKKLDIMLWSLPGAIGVWGLDAYGKSLLKIFKNIFGVN